MHRAQEQQIRSDTNLNRQAGWPRMSRLVLLCLLTSVWLPVHLAAETIRLGSGQVIEGKITNEDKDTLIIETKKGVLTINKSEIDIIDRGSQKTIARPGYKDQNPLVLAMMSFIPFYSGMFQLEQQQLGIPFAIANGLAALQYYNHHTRYVAPDGFHLDAGGIEDPLVQLSGINIGSALGSLCYNSATMTSNSACSIGAGLYSINTIAYNLFPNQRVVRTWFLGKQEMPLADSDLMLRSSLQIYLVSSLVNALLSWSYASGQEPLKILTDNGNKAKAGMPVFFVAIPAAKGYKFGLTMAF